MTVEEQLKAVLLHKDFKEHVYNYVDKVDYVVSSGSLKLDIEMVGGLRPGIARFGGPTESGKTSCALSFARQFQQMGENFHLVYVEAERELSKEMRERAGLIDSQISTIETNVYEIVIESIRNLVKNNEENRRYLFIIDSTNALMPLSDVDKKPGQANKVAGGAVITSDFLRRMSLGLGKRGHICILISQVRATGISADPKKQVYDPNGNVTSGSGGNAALHYSSWIFEFMNKDSLEASIFKSSKEEDKKIEKRIGHHCRITFKKTTNEKTLKKISYPIKHGRNKGRSIWIEREILDILRQYNFITGTTWLTFSPETLKQLEEHGFTDVPEKVQGQNKMLDFLESRPEIVDFYYNYFKETFIE